MKGYSFQKGLVKGLVALVIFAIPFFIDTFPTWANLTIGGLGMIIVNALKYRFL